jgi:precorrin-2 dehydrogenase / sirohydrochlorin ferrochelatase
VTGLPLAVDLRDRRVLVVGAGTVGIRKVTTLLEHGAAVTVVALEAVEPIPSLAEAGRVVLVQRGYNPADLDGVMLVVAATADPRLNARIDGDAGHRGVLCVRADGGGSASFLSAITHGDFLIAVSTGGLAPALAAQLRAELEDTYGPEYGQLVAVLGELRRDPHVQAKLAGLHPDERAAAWRRILDTDILTILRNNDLEHAREVASACLSLSSD